MTAVYTDVFPICVLLVILYDMQLNHSFNSKSRYFRLIVIFTLLVLAADCIAWSLDGKLFPGAKELLLFVNGVYFSFGALVSYGWFLFTFAILHGFGTFHKHWKRVILPSLPLLAFLLILLFKTDWIILLTDENHYQRGSYFFLQSVIGLGYILIGCVCAVIHGVREKVPSWRREDFLLASFVLFPFAGGIIQLINMQLVLLWPFATISLLLYYISLRNDDVQKDELTGLFNRRLLDEYLSKIFKRSVPADEWNVILIDLNRFKQINDTYGHAIGDEALKKTADILKKVFHFGKAFIARYGGDEFAVIIECSETEIVKYREKLQAAVQKANANPEQAYEISLSMGSAAYKYGHFNRLEDLVSLADKRMYEHKKSRTA